MNALAQRLLLVVLGVSCFSTVCSARESVKGYYRKDGTYVAPYSRASPGERAPGISGFAAPSLSGATPRSSAQRDRFQRLNPCPVTGSGSGACPGYVVDHVVPLKRGGADDPSNMQWQTESEAKAKDKVE